MRIAFLAVVALTFAAPSPVGKVEKLTFGSGGRTRTYYLFVPEQASAGSSPLLVLLHGSGRNGKTLIDPWLPLAKREGIILAAPDSLNSQGWRIPEDGPDFIHDLVEMLRIPYDVDPHRMYLFGHSAGAGHALAHAALESEYFAAVAVHAGVLDPALYSILDSAPRKIPVAIWVGTNDSFFPVAAVRATRDAFNSRFGLQLTEIKRHTHDYYGAYAEINKQVWAFLSQQTLAADPRYQQYQMVK